MQEDMQSQSGATPDSWLQAYNTAVDIKQRVHFWGDLDLHAAGEV